MALNSDNVSFSLGTTPVCGLNSVSLDTVLDQLDKTDFCGDGTRTFIPGLAGATIPFGGDYLPADAGQVLIVNAWKNKTLLTDATQPTFMVTTTNGFGVDAYVSSISIGATVDGKVTINGTLQCTGAVDVI